MPHTKNDTVVNVLRIACMCNNDACAIMTTVYV